MNRATVCVAFILLLPLSPVAGTLDESSDNHISAPDNRLGLYSVPLHCPLVEGLGCGGLAKPFLKELEKNPNVAQAWIDHSGTRLAIVWKAEASAKARATIVKQISKTAKLNELSGRQRKPVLQDIHARSRWYRAADVDDLSSEEAKTVAARLLDIVNSAEPLSEEQRGTLMPSFTEILKRKFIGGQLSDMEAYEELMKVARPHLGPAGTQVLDKTIREKCCASAPEA